MEIPLAEIEMGGGEPTDADIDKLAEKFAHLTYEAKGDLIQLLSHAILKGHMFYFCHIGEVPEKAEDTIIRFNTNMAPGMAAALLEDCVVELEELAVKDSGGMN